MKSKIHASKYLLIFAAISVLSTSAFAQGCDYEINAVDKFSNEEEKLTNSIVIARKVKRDNALPLRKVLAQLRKRNGERFLVLKFPLTMVMSPTFSDSDNKSKLVLLLDNKQKVTLLLFKLMNNQSDKIEFRYATDFVLFEEDIVLLKKYKVTDIRVGMNNNTFDMRLDEDASEMLMESMGCIE
jgi:hypothetical protein